MIKHRGALELELIGNCRVAALINTLGRLVWWCYPNFDGDPAFSRLLAGDEEKGFFDRLLDGLSSSRSAYLRNTAIIGTTLEDAAGNAVRITDFAPRFIQYGRNFRPVQLCRLIEPLRGLPRITLHMRPPHGYGKPCQAGGMRGNIPQTYSMAGLVNTAMRLSINWEEGLCRGSW